VDYLSHTPALGRLAYIRVLSLMISLLAFDLSLMYYAATVTLEKGPSVMLLFGFEYAVLLATCLQSIIKFFLYLEDMRRDGRWDNKGAYLLYLYFITDMFKLSVYLVFFTTVMYKYGMPIHIVRQLYLTFNSFRARVTEVIQYRKATSNMNQRFPDATQEELSRTDGVCIVCREEMTAGKKLPCGHILHFHCLRSWLERQQTCPTCRASVFVDPPQQQPAQPMPPNMFPNGAPVPPGWPPFFPPNQNMMFPFPPNNIAGPNNNNQNIQNLPPPYQPPTRLPQPMVPENIEQQQQQPPTTVLTPPTNINIIQRVEQLQQHLSLIQQELQGLHQALINNPTVPRQASSSPSSSSSSSSNHNNNNNNSSSSSDTIDDEEDQLLSQALQESAQAYEDTFKDKGKAIAPLSPSSPEEDEDRTSIRQRRLARFSNS